MINKLKDILIRILLAALVLIVGSLLLFIVVIVATVGMIATVLYAVYLTLTQET